MEKIRIREAEEKDFEALLDLAEEWTPRNREERRQLLKLRMENTRSKLLVVEVENGEIVGMVGLLTVYSWINCEIQLHIRGFYIKKSYRNKGIGTQLMRHILTNYEYDMVCASTVVEKFYSSLGFVPSTDKLYHKRKNSDAK